MRKKMLSSEKMMVGGCCVCSDERGWDENPLVYCDGQGCCVAVHQACYGIVTVPSGPWFCRVCEVGTKSTRVKCELCPSRDGALKKTDSQNGWAHVICALYIPEVRFGNVTTMEPILISLVPADRFQKTCYICDEQERGSKAVVGACMQCNKQGCKQSFHVTCAQMLGLLCEEAGNMMDNVKYCGYCQHHYSKLKKTSNMKIIPPFRPVQNPETNPVVVLNKDLSPDINMKSMKKKMPSSGSSSSASSSKSTPNQNTNSSSSSAMPRIAPSNLFSAGAFSSNLSKSSDGRDQGDGNNRTGESSSSQMVPKTSSEDSYVLKSEDLKNSSSLSSQNMNGSGDKGREYTKPGKTNLMTVKLHDVINTSLDRPIHETPSTPRDKSQPPDIKPHVTLTPIPMRSNEAGKPILFSPSSSSSNPPTKIKESPGHLDSDKPLSEISPTSFSGDTRTGWDLKPSIQNNGNSSSNTNNNGQNNTGDRNSVGTDDPLERDSNQNSLPMKRGPGRPVKRRTGPGREDERIGGEEPVMKKKSKRGGRGGRHYNRRDMREDATTPPLQSNNPTYLDDSSNDSKKPNGQTNNNNNSRKSQQQPASMKRPEEVTPTLSQLKAQMDAAKQQTLSQTDYQNNNSNINGTSGNSSSSNNNTTSSVLPTDLFGNAINPSSSMAQRMVDTLSQEMETIASSSVEKIDKPTELVGIPLPKPSSSSSGSSSNNNNNNIHPSSATNGNTGPPQPQTLEQLLERQWEQGSQFLMEQAQHLDIAQLLSCLNQLKQDNRALEEHVNSLISRKEQLMTINARLSIPLSSSISLANPGDRSFHHGDVPRSGTELHTPQQQQQQQSNHQRHNSVVVNSHPSPHLNQNHGNRESR